MTPLYDSQLAGAAANSFLDGQLDEVAIYPRVLTPEQIMRHYKIGIGG
jgi:hypothetical protein